MNGSPDPANDSDPIWKWLGGKWSLVALCLILLIVALYVEEDWRGAAEWNQTQAEIAAAGESLDPKKFIPPPVPDDQSFAALPIFKVEMISDWDADAVGMKRAFARINPYSIPTYPETSHARDQLPFLGNWQKEQEPDLPTIQMQMAGVCYSHGVKVSAGTTPLDLFELLCPALADLRAADQTHPLCRFDVFYSFRPAIEMPWASMAGCRQLVTVLAYEERLALLQHRPDLALADLKIGWKVDSGLRNEALLLSDIIARACQASQLQVIAQGLSQHVWNQQQLAELDGDLGAVDDLAAARLGVRGNVAILAVPSTDYFKKHRSMLPDMLFGPPSLGKPRPPAISEFIATSLSMLLPDGWMDEWKAQDATINLLGTVKIVDPEKHRAYPEQEVKTLHLIEDSKKTWLWNTLTLRNVRFSVEEMQRVAYAQVQIDEGRIACRLERFYLDHGHYPAALAELTPAYGTGLPHDVMNGEPYHYKLLPDGTYLLYSVAWDQKDDGGKEGAGEYHYYLDDPDWPWHNHPQAAKSK